MKKYFLLFAAGGLLTLASCGGESTPAEPTINVDSMKAAIADSTAAALQAQNDSLVNAAAQAKADSTAAAQAKADSIAAAQAKAAGKKAPARKVSKATPPKEVTPPPPPPPPAPTGLRGSSDENKQKGGLRGSSDQNQKGGLRGSSDQK